MTWCVFEVVMRLRSPLHIGHGKVGNLQRTYPYVTGRVLWGALTMRLTRDALQGRVEATDSSEYQKIGKQVHRDLAFTYFYPALKSDAGYQVAWPWEDESTFRRRFLSSYQGTGLSYPQQSAAEGMLHEVEFISPYTLDTGETVFLKGYVFEKQGCTLSTLSWQSALKRLQMGGERGYGWGDIEFAKPLPVNDAQLFGGMVTFNGDSERPVLHLQENQRVLAHTVAKNLSVAGEIEPLVGREWSSGNSHHCYVGQHVAFGDVCFTPGSFTLQAIRFVVKEFGVWREL